MTSNDFGPRIATWASSLVASAGFSEPPIDLFKLAQLRQIRSISLRAMIPRGGLVPIERGFAMYVRGEEHRDIETSDTEPRGLLSARQRFTVAHEIAHTFFYDLTHDQPELHSARPDARALENICDEAATILLIPTDLVQRDLPAAQDIDIAFVGKLAEQFNVSLTVALHILGRVSAMSPTARCLVLVRRVHNNARIDAVCFGTGLLRTLPRPTRFASLRDWLSSLPVDVIDQRHDQEWKTNSAGRTVVFRKVELGSGTSFLLQAEEAPEG